MIILVQQSGWDEGRPVDVRAVLVEAAEHFCQPLRNTVDETLHVAPTPEGQRHPITCVRRAPEEPSVASPIRILLTARGRKWAKFSYQFSHELCHVLSGYEDLEGDPNNWLHEAICELASLSTLRRMSEAWRTDPPYPHWADYAGALADYADETERDYREETELLPGETLSSWLASHEEELRACRELRAKNAIVARELLPLFESEPSGWNAVRRFPRSSSSLKTYLDEWASEVEADDRPFVERIIQRFEE